MAYKLPAMDMMGQGLCGEIEDTLGDDHPAFALKEKAENALIGNNKRAVMSAAYKAENLGSDPVVCWAAQSKEKAAMSQEFTRRLRNNSSSIGVSETNRSRHIVLEEIPPR